MAIACPIADAAATLRRAAEDYRDGVVHGDAVLGDGAPIELTQTRLDLKQMVATQYRLTDDWAEDAVAVILPSMRSMSPKTVI